eukprot:TRINITY_DN54047_c0_g1_i1.p1 TRINITY_DN54047_c0_g1~~TRINITY_DN54047_c0_g1_i1.p1  ORF type:complete len:462 (+),score=51.19 TRINITY_DN54047_c0_g1_i1:23-1387(+)
MVLVSSTLLALVLGTQAIAGIFSGGVSTPSPSRVEVAPYPFWASDAGLQITIRGLGYRILESDLPEGAPVRQWHGDSSYFEPLLPPAPAPIGFVLLPTSLLTPAFLEKYRGENQCLLEVVTASTSVASLSISESKARENPKWPKLDAIPFNTSREIPFGILLHDSSLSSAGALRSLVFFHCLPSAAKAPYFEVECAAVTETAGTPALSVSPTAGGSPYFVLASVFATLTIFTPCVLAPQHKRRRAAIGSILPFLYALAFGVLGGYRSGRAASPLVGIAIFQAARVTLFFAAALICARESGPLEKKFRVSLFLAFAAVAGDCLLPLSAPARLQRAVGMLTILVTLVPYLWTFWLACASQPASPPASPGMPEVADKRQAPKRLAILGTALLAFFFAVHGLSSGFVPAHPWPVPEGAASLILFLVISLLLRRWQVFGDPEEVTYSSLEYYGEQMSHL